MLAVFSQFNFLFLSLPGLQKPLVGHLVTSMCMLTSLLFVNGNIAIDAAIN